jgi:hypothetical protein
MSEDLCDATRRYLHGAQPSPRLSKKHKNENIRHKFPDSVPDSLGFDELTMAKLPFQR